MKINKSAAALLLVTMVFFMLCSCATIPEGATAVRPFDKEKYLMIASQVGYDTSDLIWVEHNEEQQ